MVKTILNQPLGEMLNCIAKTRERKFAVKVCQINSFHAECDRHHSRHFSLKNVVISTTLRSARQGRCDVALYYVYYMYSAMYAVLLGYNSAEN
jgi:hypothetical protein